MSVEHEKLKRILAEAAAQTTPGARAAYLDAACAGDAALRAEIDKLLQAHDQAGDFLEQPAAPFGVPASAGPVSLPPEGGTPNGPGPTIALSTPLSEKPGDRIGHYKLLQQIGEGGCGVVYMAEQEEPIRRRVALKVIKLGMDTKQVIARFVAERQALALMDHPNIAKIYDAGVTGTPVAQASPPAGSPGVPPGVVSGGETPPKPAGEDACATLSAGRPYFVMELVRGIRITDYCDQNNLSTEARLDLFIQVCHAIQHAHQKGIIHRDIKPSNILVTINDGVPVPKVIDFGIAKATEQRLTDKTLFTAFEQFIGTPAYMSPEQAVMTSLDIDTRSDIYALGVLLYELLTGQTPFDARDLIAAGLDEMRRIIREKDPPRPSTRLSSLADAEQTTVAKRRQVEPPRLIHLVRGDLDWIVMKCLEKDRTRRYETANGLADDILRHLNNEPVTAAAPGSLYRAGKFIRRHKAGLATTAALVLLLAVGAVVSTWQAVRATRAERAQSLLRQQAEQARVNEARLRQKAEADEQKAQTEAAKSRQVAQFLRDMLQGVGPSVALGRDTTMLREILDRTALRLSKDLKDQPEVEADLRHTLGWVYNDLGDDLTSETFHRDALALRRKLYGEDHRDVAESLNGLGQALWRQGKLPEAETAHREALAISRKMSGNDDLRTARMLVGLALAINSQGKPAEAEALYREALSIRRKFLGEAHADLAWSLSLLATTLDAQGKLVEAETLHREALAMRRKLFGNKHPEVALSLMALGWVWTREGKLAEAESSLSEAVAMQRELLGNEHPHLLTSLSGLVCALSRRGKLAEAQEVCRELIELKMKRPGSENEVAVSLNSLAYALARAGKLAEAELLCRQALELRRNLPGNNNQALASSLDTLARVLVAQGKLAESEPLYREAADLWRKEAESGNAQVFNPFAWLLATCVHPALRDGTTAVSFAEKAVAATDRKNTNYLDTLAAACAEAGQFAKAVSVQQEAIALSPDGKMKEEFKSRLKLYESNSPYRERGFDYFY